MPCAAPTGSVEILTARSSSFFNDTATTEIYTLSLHDALPILADKVFMGRDIIHCAVFPKDGDRSEERTSELQSHDNLVCRLLLGNKPTAAARRGAGSHRPAGLRERNFSVRP